MVILHTETSKKQKKNEKNHLHIYLTIFLILFFSEVQSEKTENFTEIVICQSQKK